MMQHFKLFVTCPAGVEALLIQELELLGALSPKETVTGVICEADLNTLYRINLCSRLANRVLLVLNERPSGGRDELYQAVAAVEWHQHLRASDSLRVDFAGTNDQLRHTQFSSMVVKDAIVDHFVARNEARPEVDLRNPQHRINVRLTKKAIYVSLDLSGDSLHKRGYRQSGGMAPLKENLAAALLVRSGWPKLLAQASAQNPVQLLDPMCGSGTLLIEAAMMALNIAPGLGRVSWGFEHWGGHRGAVWQEQVTKAKLEFEQRLAEWQQAPYCQFLGFELDERVFASARQNCSAHKLNNVDGLINLRNANFLTADLSGLITTRNGLLICNPPYGMRIGEEDKLNVDYQQLAAKAKMELPGWSLALFSSNASLLASTRLRSDKKYKLFNGPLACELRLYSIGTENKLRDDRLPERKQNLSDGAQMFVNRLKKNLKRLKPWIKKENLEAYRVYDADLPEYSAAIDYYAGRLHVQEYQAPSSIDESKVKSRLEELIVGTAVVFDLKPDDIAVKTRQRNRGTSQYQQQADRLDADFFNVMEGQARLQVNLKAYLDTGLFLDHRPLRLRLAGEIKGKDFLNLFCYTASASVHCALAGATSTTSVDMSNTYLNWAKKNFELNGLNSKKHVLERADVRAWLGSCTQQFDVIMLDPPSFSNSKNMDTSFDVQRDHVDLVERCMAILRPGGVLYFSNNLRSFKIDPALNERFVVTNIGAETIAMDFERNPKIHQCFKLESR